MSTYYRHRRTEQTKVPYSFRCEQCMQESGLMLAKIAGMEVTMSSNYNDPGPGRKTEAKGT